MSKIENYINIHIAMQEDLTPLLQVIGKAVLEQIFWSMTDEEQGMVKYKLKELRSEQAKAITVKIKEGESKRVIVYDHNTQESTVVYNTQDNI